MKSVTYILCLMLFLGIVGCSTSTCPANSQATSHRQLKKINSKRKRDRGLFPPSTRPENRKEKQKKVVEPEL